MKNIAIFASGEGTNAQNIINYFKSNAAAINVVLVVSNNANAKVLNRAMLLGLRTIIVNREMFYNSNKTIDELKFANIDLIVLAGFLWRIPEHLIDSFPNKIINIHPALLPKFGGKGMYGINVHKAVIEAKEKESGISIHFVNSEYDEGKLISQHKCEISPSDTPEILAQKVHELEIEYFPKAIFNLLIQC